MKAAIARVVLIAAILAALFYVVLEGLSSLSSKDLWGESELRGRVTDEHGATVADAQVLAEYYGDPSACPPRPGSPPGLTDVKGQFALKATPGAVTLFARKEGVGFSQRIDLELVDEQEITGIELVLDPGGRIIGQCLGVEGDPLPGQWIAIESAKYWDWWWQDRIFARTGAAGEFVFEDVPSGEVRVMLSDTFPRAPRHIVDQDRCVVVRHHGTTHVRFVVPALEETRSDDGDEVGEHEASPGAVR